MSEGFFEIDNRECPVLVTPSRDVGTVKQGDHFKSATYTCCGCQRVVILRPDRSRPRNYCRGCDSDMCDDCALSMKVSGTHTPFNKVLDDFYAAVVRGLPTENIVNANRSR